MGFGKIGIAGTLLLIIALSIGSADALTVTVKYPEQQVRLLSSLCVSVLPIVPYFATSC